MTHGSSSAVVAILDSGVSASQPDVAGKVVMSQNFSDSPTVDDLYGHGTHVAGIVAAATNNGAGVAGVGYPLQVMVYKVLRSDGTGPDAAIANAIMSAADAGAQVISLSLGAPGYSVSMQAAVNYAWQRNALVVAAAGNSSSSGLFFPAGLNYAVGVSATDSNNALASFSNFGNGVDLAAPGVNVYSTAPTYSVTTGWFNYVSLSGTSMATPHVSAIAGLVAMTTPGTSAAAILKRMQQTASSSTVGGGWDQNFGYGIVNAYNAVAGVFRTATNGSVTGQIVDTGGLSV